MLAVVVALLGLSGTAAAQVVAPPLPANDLEASLPGGQVMSDGVVPIAPHPKLAPTPRATCDKASQPLNDPIQGRVSQADMDQPQADKGWTCNTRVVGRYPTPGGFRVWRFRDRNGHVCGFYDSSMGSPLNLVSISALPTQGVVVLDMSDPAHPVQTAALTTPGMISPHESLNLNTARGLLAAVNGNPATYPGYVDIYDLHADCRHPVMDYGGVLAPLGHESGFSMDGKTFWATGTASKSVTAIDVTDPKAPHVVEQIQVQSHGMSLSDDGNRAYIADPTGRNMLILDTSQIQARKANPQVTEVSRITWSRVSIPQNAIPFTENGHPYVLEFDEYNQSTLSPGSDPDTVGAARIIDIADEKTPKLVSNIRLAIDNPAEHKQYGGDPGADGSTQGGAQGYAAHYCNIPTRVDPKLVACSFIASGLRLFNISDLAHPKEVGYFVAPTQAKPENGGSASNFAMSMPAFVPQRREIWWTDGTSGFYALRVADGAWAEAAKAKPPAVQSICLSKRRFTIHLPARVRTARVYVDGKRVAVRRRGLRLQSVVDLRKLKFKTVTVRITGRTKGGKAFRQTRRYHTCRPGS